MQNQIFSDGFVFPPSHMEGKEDWINGSGIPCPIKTFTTHNWPPAVTSVCYFQHIYICSINRVSYNFTRGDSGGTLSIGAVIVLNGWWLKPAWFCYSRCLQLERLPTMTAIRHHCTDLSLPLESANAGQHCYHKWCSITAQLPPICYKYI